jgi:hypothetical protein
VRSFDRFSAENDGVDGARSRHRCAKG